MRSIRFKLLSEEIIGSGHAKSTNTLEQSLDTFSTYVPSLDTKESVTFSIDTHSSSVENSSYEINDKHANGGKSTGESSLEYVDQGEQSSGLEKPGGEKPGGGKPGGDKPRVLSVDDGEVDETNLGLDASNIDTITGQIVVDYGGDGPGSVVANGDMPSGLTSNGYAVDVFVNQLGNYMGTANGEIIFKLQLNPDGSYIFHLVGTLDHPDYTDHNDVLTLSFGFNAVDADGDSASSAIQISVFDDGPVAVNDDGGDLNDNVTVASGNVLDNDGGADGFADSPLFYIFHNGEDNGEAVPSNGSTTILGTYGELTISFDGSYTYTAFQNAGTGVDVFEYTIKDADGDKATAELTFNVDMPRNNQKPIILGIDAGLVDETDLVSDGTDSISGNINVDYGGEGPGLIIANGNAPTDLTSDGEPVSIEVDSDGNYVGSANGNIIFTLEINDDHTYTFNLLGTLDHPDTNDNNDALVLEFGVSAVDNDGDTVPTVIEITVLDDGLMANDDEAEVCCHSEEGTHVTGNALGNDDIGVEGAPIVSIGTVDGGFLAVPEGGSITIDGTYGSLEIFSDGWYQYTTSVANIDATDIFFYTIMDADGDTSTAQITFNIVCGCDDEPTVITPDIQVVDETDLGPDGIDSVSGQVVADFGDNASGSIEANGDAPTGLTSGGADVIVTVNADGHYVGLANGDEIFTLEINTDGSYTFNLTGVLDHPDATDHDDFVSLFFGVDAVSSNGNSVSTTIQIDVYDDGPMAVNDDGGDLSCEDDIMSVSDNVLINDSAGEDGYADVAISSALHTTNGSGGDMAPGGSLTINGAYGVLELSADGSYTYTAFDDAGIGTDIFFYTIMDADGDTSIAQISFDVSCVDDEPIVITPDVQVVDETDLGPDGIDSVSGQVVADFGNDGPGSIEANGDAPTGLTSGGADVIVTVNADGHYVGLANGDEIFTLEINADGSYTFNLTGVLDHPDATDHDDFVSLFFGVDAVSSNGNSVSTTIQINVYDDGPMAVDDQVDCEADTDIIDGNVLINDNSGEDGFDDSPVVSINLEGSSDVISVPAGGSTIITGIHGELEIFSDGTYEYTANAGQSPYWVDVEVDDLDWGLLNGFNIPLDVTVETNGVLDYVIVDLTGAFGNNPDTSLSVGVEVSPGVWQVQAADVDDIVIELPDGNSFFAYLGNQWGTNEVSVTAYLEDAVADVFNYTITDADGDSSTAQLGFTACGISDTDDANIAIFVSPLIFDLDGDGVEHTYYEDGDILFDINVDGVVDHTGWVGADDGFLALDQNGNGLIDNGSELFGSDTQDGFTILAQYDSNMDGFIDASDDVWSDLVIWQDVNQNGVSEQSELFGLDEIGIASINLNAIDVNEFDNGNFISDVSDFTWADGSSGIVEDVWFAYVSGDQETSDLTEPQLENSDDALYGDCEIADGCTLEVLDDQASMVDDVLISPEGLDTLNALDQMDDVLQDSINEFLEATGKDVDAAINSGPCVVVNDVTYACGVDTSVDTKLDDLMNLDLSTTIL